MARTDRQQRRQRRAQAAGVPPLRPAPRPQPAAKEQEAAAVEAQSVARPSDGRRGFPGVSFLQEAVAELKKVEWPGQQAVVSGTAVVLVACLIVGVYLYLNDRLWSYVVQHVLLR